MQMWTNKIWLHAKFMYIVNAFRSLQIFVIYLFYALTIQLIEIPYH